MCIFAWDLARNALESAGPLKLHFLLEGGAPLTETTTKWIYLCAGWSFIALGVVGIFLPVLPTTPFILLAAWCFSKGSERLHHWLLTHPRFGPMVRDWEESRVIRLRAKLLATAMIVPLTSYMLLGTDAPAWTKLAAAALVLWGLLFIWTKPSAVASEAEASEPS